MKWFDSMLNNYCCDLSIVWVQKAWCIVYKYVSLFDTFIVLLCPFWSMKASVSCRARCFHTCFEPELDCASFSKLQCLFYQSNNCLHLITGNNHVGKGGKKHRVSHFTSVFSSPSWELELRPLGVATGNALSVTRSEDTYVKTPPVGRRQPMTSLPAYHNISAAGRIHHQLFRLHWLVCLKRAEWIW